MEMHPTLLGVLDDGPRLGSRPDLAYPRPDAVPHVLPNVAVASTSLDEGQEIGLVPLKPFEEAHILASQAHSLTLPT
jgi:hypothetical protein